METHAFENITLQSPPPKNAIASLVVHFSMRPHTSHFTDENFVILVAHMKASAHVFQNITLSSTVYSEIAAGIAFKNKT